MNVLCDANVYVLRENAPNHESAGNDETRESGGNDENCENGGNDRNDVSDLMNGDAHSLDIPLSLQLCFFDCPIYQRLLVPMNQDFLVAFFLPYISPNFKYACRF
jgi:hypothetical protein